MAIAAICISLVTIGINIWSIRNMHRSYEWLRWRVTRLGILEARAYVDRYRASGVTYTSRNVFSGSYKRRYARAFQRTLAAKEVY